MDRIKHSSESPTYPKYIGNFGQVGFVGFSIMKNL